MLCGGFTQRGGGDGEDEEGIENDPILGWALAKLASRNNMALLERLDPAAESALQGSLGPWPRDDDDNDGGDGNDDDDGASVSNASEAAFETLQRAQAHDSEGVHQVVPGNSKSNGGNGRSGGGGSFSLGGPFPQFFVVVAGPLHLHSEPGVGGRIVAELAGGSIIKIIGKLGTFVIFIKLILKIQA